MDKIDRKTIIVLGMHRSGTSAIASILHHSGINMGEDCNWKGEDNPKGFYEDREITFYNEYLLSVAESSWDNPPTKEKLFMISAMPDIQRKIIDLVKIRNNRNNIWGIKEPRMALLIELYVKFLINPIFICVHRNILSVARSLNKRNQLSIEYGIKLSIKYMDAITTFIEKYNYPRLYVSYENLLKYPKGNIEALCNFIGIPVKLGIEHLIDNQLNHF